MIRKDFVSLVIVLSGLLALTTNAADVNVDDLIKNMTVEEKCGQMTQITFSYFQADSQDDDSFPIDMDKLKETVNKRQAGSLLNAPFNIAANGTTWQLIIKTIQDLALNNRLKIPVLYGLDSIHGVNYLREGILFPQPLSMAATFNIEIAERVGAITAMETRALGVPWNFNPVLDAGRHPLWPRIYETYGEDAVLSIEMGKAYIRGSQGENNDFKNVTKVATCMKHYIGYSTPLNGKDRTTALIPEITLREHFLPPFEAAVKIGSPTVMINSGDVNGIPGHANSYYINDILKGELGFDGMVVSDWEDIQRFYTRDKIAETPEEAVRIGIMAGVDMSMVPENFDFTDHCISLAKKDQAFLNRVNDANRRILNTKKAVGLFENPYPDPKNLDRVNTDESHAFNLQAARESIILAKNDGNTLPLSKTAKILVTGPTADLLKVLNGGWSYTWQGDNEDNFNRFGRPKTTVYKSILNKNSNTQFKQGVNFTNVVDIEDAVNAAKTVDVIVLCVGEATYTETPGNIESILLNDEQYQLSKALLETGKPVVVVYLGGRPRHITEMASKAQGVILGFLPGNRGGEAIADVLFGDFNPSGRLPITYPSTLNSFATYDYKPLEIFPPNQIDYLYLFGHGLSYTQFAYSNLQLNSSKLVSPNGVKITVDVKNSGSKDGQETVILYLNDECGSVSRPVKQMKGFKKINLKSGAQTTVTFELSINDLSFINAYNKRVVENGFFNIYISDKTQRFELANPVPPQTTTPTPQVTTTPVSLTTTTTSSSNILKSSLNSLIQIVLASILLSILY